MGDFGKRTQRRSPGRPAKSAPRQPEPAAPELISKRDLKYIEKGYPPVWMRMSPQRLIVMVALLPMLILAAIGYYGVGVARDLRYAGTFIEAADLRATEGKCQRYVFLVTLCSAKIRSLTADAPEQTSPFMMFFRSGDGARLVPVRSTSNPSVVGIHYAVSTVLLNRTLSLLGVTGFFGWIWWIFFDCIRKGRYTGGPAHQAVLQHLALRAQPA